MHDGIPGVDGDPRGYLHFQTEDVTLANVRWQIRTVFVPEPDGRPELLDNGYWEVIGGTQELAGQAGAGTDNPRMPRPSYNRHEMAATIRSTYA